MIIAFLLGVLTGAYIISFGMVVDRKSERAEQQKTNQRIIGRLKENIESHPEASLMEFRAGLYKAIEIVEQENRK